MVSKIMNKGKLEVRYKDCILEITPDWFVISDVDDGVKYTCETKDAYPRNMDEDIWIAKDNRVVENLECWLHYLSFNNKYIDDDFQCLIAAYANDYIEEHLEEFGMALKQVGFDIKYIK